MTRTLYAGRIGDTVASLYRAGDGRGRVFLAVPADAEGYPTPVVFTVWDEPDGTQITDLLAADGTTAITTVTVPASDIQVPGFYGPDGLTADVWLKDPAGVFFRMDASPDAAAADATAAAERAEDAAASVPGMWQPSTVYTAGSIKVAPDGSTLSRLANGTSRPSFDSTEKALWQSVLSKPGTIEQTDLTTSTAAAIAAAIGQDLAGFALGPGYDVLLAAGQSGIVGAGGDPDTVNFEVTDPRIKTIPTAGVNAGKIVTANDPLIHQNTISTGHVMAFARWLVRYLAPNRTLIIVGAGRGGSGFSTSSNPSPPAGFYYLTGTNMGSWDPANGSGGFSLADAAIALSNAAMAKKMTPDATNRFIGMMWHQGEADAGLSEAAYGAKLDALLARFRTEITGAAADTPVIVGQLLPENIAGSAGLQNVNRAHIDTPRRQIRAGFYYGEAGHGLVDGIHYDVAGNRLLGVSASEAWGIAVANVLGVAPIAPTAVTLVQSGTTVTASWTRPKGRATDYNVRWRVNGGSWTNLTRTQSIDKTATITGLTLGDVLDVQARTVNEAGTSAWSASGSMTVATVPGQVTGLTAGSATISAMPLSWTAVAGATSYLIEYKLHSAGSWSTFGTVTGVTGTVIGLVDSSSYDFRVSATNAAGTGTASSTTTASTAAPTCLLDDVGVSAFRAYGLRKQRAAYAGSAIRVRRSSDNTEQNIGFATGTNDLDTAAMATFAAGSSLYVKTLYDQSGNSRDLTQTSTGRQPRIMNAGTLDTVNSRPSLVFAGTADFSDSTTGLWASGHSSWLGVVKASASALQWLWSERGSATSGRTVVYADAAGVLTTINVNDAGTTQGSGAGGTVASGSLVQASTVDTGTNLSTWLNGTAGANSAYTRAGATTVGVFSFGALVTSGSPSSPWLGNISEMVFFDAALTTGQRQAGQSNQKAYFGTP